MALPSHLERSFSGFIIRRDAIIFKVNTDNLLTQIAALKDQLLIGKFERSKTQSSSNALVDANIKSKIEMTHIDNEQKCKEGIFHH